LSPGGAWGARGAKGGQGGQGGQREQHCREKGSHHRLIFAWCSATSTSCSVSTPFPIGGGRSTVADTGTLDEFAYSWPGSRPPELWNDNEQKPQILAPSSWQWRQIDACPFLKCKCSCDVNRPNADGASQGGPTRKNLHASVLGHAKRRKLGRDRIHLPESLQIASDRRGSANRLARSLHPLCLAFSI